MNINFNMWGRALTELVKMDSKQEWDKLDAISKWLIATRSAVTAVTLYAAVIAGLLAWRELSAGGKEFNWLTWVIVTLGLFIAHGTNNLLNDYTDFSRGVDQDDYFRTQYGVHPLVQGFWTKRQQLTWFAVSGVLASLCGVYALFVTSFSPLIIGLFIFGAILLMFYTWPLKYLGLGELFIFIVWGPVLVGAIYLVMMGAWTPGTWLAVLAGVPFGFTVVSINIGKHIDKRDADAAKGVGTLPVKIGEKAARYINMAALVLSYLVILYLIFVPHYFTPILLIVVFATRRLLLALGVLTKPRPAQPPKDWAAWPTWFSALAFYHNRLFGGLFILGILLDTALRLLFPALPAQFWAPL